MSNMGFGRLYGTYQREEDHLTEERCEFPYAHTHSHRQKDSFGNTGKSRRQWYLLIDD